MKYQRKVLQRYLTIKEEAQLLRHVGQFKSILARRDLAWMQWALQSGVRVSVLVGMTVGDARNALQTHYFKVRPEINKRNTGYQFYATKKGRLALNALLQIRSEMGYEEQAEAPLIMSRNHHGMSERSFQDRLQKWRLSAGLTIEISPHWFRHTKAMRIMQSDSVQDPRGTAQSALGHSSIESTAVYTQPSREQQERDLEAAS